MNDSLDNDKPRIIATVFYAGGGSFVFEPDDDRAMRGRLRLDKSDEDRLKRLLSQQEDDWWADEHGNRLEDDALFAKSPWSMMVDGRTFKLVLRFFDGNDHRATFSTQDEGILQLYDWMQHEGTPR